MKYLKIACILLCLFKFLPGKAQPEYYVNRHGVRHNYGFWGNRTGCNITIRVDSFTKHAAFGSGSNFTGLLYLEGARSVDLSSLIHKDSLSFFRYSVIVNDSDKLADEKIPSGIEFVYPERSDHPGYVQVSLGNYVIAGKKLRLEMYNILRKQERYSAVLHAGALTPPRIVALYMYRMDTMMGSAFPRPIHENDIISASDKSNGLLIGARSTPFWPLYYVYLKHVPSGNVTRLFNNWSVTGDTMVLSVAGDYITKSGPYEISIVGESNENMTLTPLAVAPALYHFRVKGNTATFSYNELGIMAGCVFAGALLIFFFIKRKQRRKLFLEKQQKELVQMRLNAVRQQLNPHFMFNALAGIQNLMNKKDIDNANGYLGKFARITRHVLANRDLNSLKEEKELLDDYLQMEQLRFGFSYKIEIDNNLDAANIEIPVMVLQPFVENAVKHGLAGKGSEGLITVEFRKHDKELQLMIIDNGEGFDVTSSKSGLGLLLSRNRISLLNQLYKQNKIVLDIASGKSGTIVSIHFKNWL